MQTTEVVEHLYSIKRQTVHKDKSLFMGSEEDLSLFDFSWLRSQARSPRLNWTSLRIYVDPNVETIQKSIYSVFDLVRDLGGVACVFAMVSQLATHMLTYNQL